MDASHRVPCTTLVKPERLVVAPRPASIERSHMTNADLPRQKVDRAEVFIEYTKSICPVCKVVVDARVHVRENKVFLWKRCREHGSCWPT